MTMCEAECTAARKTVAEKKINKGGWIVSGARVVVREWHMHECLGTCMAHSLYIFFFFCVIMCFEAVIEFGLRLTTTPR